MVAVENLLTVEQLKQKITMVDEKLEKCNDNYLKAKLLDFKNRCLKAQQKINKYKANLVAKHPALKSKPDFLKTITLFDIKDPKKLNNKLKVNGKVDNPLGKMRSGGTFVEWLGDHKGLIAGIGYTAAALQVANTITIATVQKDIGKLLWEGLSKVFGSQIGRGLVFAAALAGGTTLLLKLPTIQRNLQKKKMKKLDRQNERMQMNAEFSENLPDLDQRGEKGLRIETMIKMSENPGFEEKILGALDEKINNGDLTSEQRLFAIAQKNKYISFRNERKNEYNTGEREVAKEKTKLSQNEALDSLVSGGADGRPHDAAEQEAQKSEIKYSEAKLEEERTKGELETAQSEYDADDKVKEIKRKYSTRRGELATEIPAEKSKLETLESLESESKTLEGKLIAGKTIDEVKARIRDLEGDSGLIKKEETALETTNSEITEKTKAIKTAKSELADARAAYNRFYASHILTLKEPDVKTALGSLAATVTVKETILSELNKELPKLKEKRTQQNQKIQELKEELASYTSAIEADKRLQEIATEQGITLSGNPLSAELHTKVEAQSDIVKDKQKEEAGLGEKEKQELAATEKGTTLAGKKAAHEEAARKLEEASTKKAQKVSEAVVKGRKKYAERLKIAQSVFGADVADLVLNATFDNEGNVVSLSTVQPGSSDLLVTNASGDAFPSKLTVEYVDEKGKVVQKDVEISDRAAFDALLEKVKAARQQIKARQQEQGLANE